MLKNFILSAWRNILKHKGYSGINIFGLALGAAVAILIGLWIADELSFDHYHANYKRIAQVMDVQSKGKITTEDAVAIPLASTLRSNYAETFKHVALVFPNFVHTLSVGDKRLAAPGTWAEPDLPEMLGFRMVAGEREALKQPSSALINQSLARSLFGEGDPIGKTILVDNYIAIKVGGVFEDLPENTTFHGTRIFLSWEKAIASLPWLRALETRWDTRNWKLFVEVNDGVDLTRTSARISNIVAPRVTDHNETIFLHPMTRWHLYNEFQDGKEAGGRIRLVWLFGIIGAFVLFLACVNFMNLSTARSEKRAREVGIRKAIGSLRIQLIGQFLSESIILTCLSYLAAIVLAQIAIYPFNSIIHKHLSIPYGSPLFWGLILLAIFITGFVAGSYPAFYLSGFRPIKVLKGNYFAGRSGSLPRKILIVFQFAVSMILIMGTIIVYQQIQHAKDRPVGYSREGLISISMNTPEIYNAPYNRLREDLIRNGGVSGMAESSINATEAPTASNDYYWRGKNPNLSVLMGTVDVTHDFGATVGWHITDGRNFSRDFPTDTGAVILNETAVRLTNLSKPIGEVIQFGGKSHTIIGVVADMVMESPYNPSQPTIFCLNYTAANSIIARVNPALSMQTAISEIEEVFKRYAPGGAFEYQFTEEEYARKFANEERIGNLSMVFAVFAIFISCLGLYGLASFAAEQRRKEIGVRKVLGASVVNVWALLLRDFAMLVILAMLIASPAVYFLMYRWLQNYQYHADISLWLFLLVGTSMLTLALLTVSYQTIKAALLNPSVSLKNQ